MSAFVVSDGTMDRVVSAIMRLRQHSIKGGFGDVATSDPAAGDKIGRALYAMNIKAVAARYGREAPMPAYRWRPCGFKEPVRAYKAVECLLYQCHEGDVPETALYRELAGIKGALASEIISELPRYRNAPWDIARDDPRNAA